MDVESLSIKEGWDGVYASVAKELILVKRELFKQIKTYNKDIDRVVEYFFKKPGKWLRPILTLLSAKAANPNPSEGTRSNLVLLATIFEMIHSASLIHDDIIDNARMRRYQTTLNERFGDHKAVLVGDMLYSKAFTLLARRFDREIIESISRCVEEMCHGELRSLISGRFNGYLKIIEAKTANFMSICCECGARVNRAEERVSKILADYGFNLGMCYQIVDDYIDEDLGLNMHQAEEFASKAKGSIEDLRYSIYKERLYDLVDHILKR